MTDNVLTDLKAKHGTIFEISASANDELGIPAVTVYCRKPSREEFACFAKNAQTNSAAAMQNLLVACLLEPTALELKPMFDDFPGLMFVVGGKLQAMIGATVETSVKKL